MALAEYMTSSDFYLREAPQEPFALNELLKLQALEYLGSKTRKYTDPHNGLDPELGFDCSGLVRRVLNDMDYPISRDLRHANEFFNFLGIGVHEEARRAGDLVFFSYNGIWPTHVGIMVNQDEFIHARYTNTEVCIEKLEPRLKIANHPEQVYFKNPIGFKRLAVPEGRYFRFNSPSYSTRPWLYPTS